MVAARIVLILLLAGCGGGSQEPQETVEAPDRPTPSAAPIVAPGPGKVPQRCEKDDPKNVIVSCQTVDGLRSCRSTNRCNP